MRRSEPGTKFHIADELNVAETDVISKNAARRRQIAECAYLS